MGKNPEQNRDPQQLGALLGLPPELADLIKRAVVVGKIPDYERLNYKDIAIFRAAAGFLSTASLGMQLKDFNNREDTRLRHDPDKKLKARDLAVETLFPMLFPDREIPNSLQRTESTRVHNFLVQSRTLLYKASDGVAFDEADKQMIPQFMEFMQTLREKSRINKNGKNQ